MRLVKAIFNTSFGLVGFAAEGKAREFGELGTAKVVRNVTINDLVASKFKNSQIEVRGNIIHEVGDFKIKNLPGMIFDGEAFTDVDNSIKLVRRILIDGELAGFDVVILGRPARLTSADIINRSVCLRTDNYVVRFNKDKKYIAGKPGMSLDTLPAVSLTSDAKTSTKKATRTAVATPPSEAKGAYTAIRISPFDMITLCDVLTEMGGKFIYLPGVVYNRTGKADKVTAKEFKKTGVEISRPDIKYSDKKVNTNLPFNQIGQLIIKVAGANKTYYPFTYKDKVIFKGGELNSPYLGIVIRQDRVNDLIKVFGKSMALAVIDDPLTNMYVKTFMNVPDPEAYTLLALNTTGLSPMSKTNAEQYRLTEAAIKENVIKMVNVKAAISYTKGLIKDVEVMLPTGARDPRPKYDAYKTCKQVELDALTDAGVNIYTGAYEKVEDAAEATGAKAKVEDTDEVADIAVEIVYGVKGLKTAPTYATISKNPEKALAKFPLAAELCDKAKNIYSTPGNVYDIYSSLKKLEKDLNKVKDSIVKTLWLNNIACYTLGGYKDFQVNDRANWTTAGTVKTGVQWDYIGEGMGDTEGLTCTVKGNYCGLV
jgi:hypothetical protein